MISLSIVNYLFFAFILLVFSELSGFVVGVNINLEEILCHCFKYFFLPLFLLSGMPDIMYPVMRQSSASLPFGNIYFVPRIGWGLRIQKKNKIRSFHREVTSRCHFIQLTIKQHEKGERNKVLQA